MSESQSSTRHEIRGTLKRSRNDKLVVEVGSQVTGSIQAGDIVVLDGAEYTVTDRGRPFLVGEGRSRTSRVYLYLAEAPLPVDAVTLVGCGRRLDVVAGWAIRSPYQDGPRYLTVLRVSTRYYAEDAMSFGDDGDCGYVTTAVCRPATDEEAAPEIAKEAEAAHKRQTERQRATLAKRIREAGTRPERADTEGERLMDRQTIYGGGDWFVLGAERVWYVLNNGADGDDWSLNNVRTGGAGGIGWYVPRTDELVEELRSIAAVLDPPTTLEERHA